MLLGALAAVLTLAFAGVALAKDIQCTTDNCVGTRHADTILERVGTGEDNIFGRRGGDVIDATGSQNDVDNLFGNRGDDTLDATDGDDLDTLNGGPGTDECFGDEGDTF